MYVVLAIDLCIMLVRVLLNEVSQHRSELEKTRTFDHRYWNFMVRP